LARTTRLQSIVATLTKHHGKPAPHPAGRDPLALIFWEIVAYLSDDDTRLVAFTALRERVGLSAVGVCKASPATLAAICRMGGAVEPERRARRLQEVAALALEEFDGDLTQLLGWEYKKACSALRKFPSVGEPGADRILMLCGSHAVLGLDSNALRVLCRIGYGTESRNYTKTYRESRDAAMAELPGQAGALATASLLFRAHGQATCKTSAPRCEECKLTSSCRWFAQYGRERQR
jgi:endonuclease III